MPPLECQDLSADQVWRRHPGRPNGDIGFTPRQIQILRTDYQLEFDVRIGFGKIREISRKVFVCDVIGSSDPDCSAWSEILSLNLQLQFVEFRSDPPCVIEQLGPGYRELVTIRQTFEQPRIDLLLECVDSPERSRVIDAKVPRSPLQRAGFRHGQEKTQVIPIHVIALMQI
jgi:hypothetical protein